MWSILLVTALLATARTKQIHTASDLQSTTVATVLDSNPHSISRDSVAVSCERDAIHITVTLPPPQRRGRNSGSDAFNGIIYPAGLGSNSSCLREYVSQRGDLQYTLPLKGCNTMANDNDDGTIEYYNTIIVQPQLRLVTGQGRGYHVACRYSHRDLTHFHVYSPRADRLTNSLSDSPDDQIEFDDEPSVKMKIYKGDPKNKQVASNVRIGEPLTLVVSLQKQKQYGVLVSECAVGDGLGWAEQTLIANDGCPLDGEIMGMFHYSPDRQQAHVSFPAHKFPYTASVYYTCEVKLCDLSHPTDCEACSHNRVRRDVADLSEDADDEYSSEAFRRRRETEGAPARVEVFSGLYVNEPDSPDLIDDVRTEKKDGEICISQRNFAIGICIAGVILMICVIAAIAFILARRRSPKAHSRTGSSLYSGPYTNTGYSHTS